MALPADDVLEIMALARRFNDANDRGDAEAWAATFLPDGTFDSPFGRITGHYELASWRRSLPTNGTRHVCANEIVEGTGDEATMTSSFLLIATEARPATVAMTGGYEDRLRKHDGRWRFVERKHIVDPGSMPG